MTSLHRWWLFYLILLGGSIFHEGWELQRLWQLLCCLHDLSPSNFNALKTKQTSTRECNLFRLWLLWLVISMLTCLNKILLKWRPIESCHQRKNNTAPVHPQLHYLPQCLPLNPTLLSSNHPKQTYLLGQSFTEKVYEWYGIILNPESSHSAILRLLYIA